MKLLKLYFNTSVASAHLTITYSKQENAIVDRANKDVNRTYYFAKHSTLILVY